MADVVMPRLSDSMQEGTILQWLKATGDEVAVGDELVEIETDKANMVYGSDLAGTLAGILVAAGETVPIGTPIARVGGSAEGSEASAAGPVGAGDLPPAAVAEASSRVAPADGDGRRVKASPLARRMAREGQLDLAKLHGSGPGGRIVKADVESAAARPVVETAGPSSGSAKTAKGQVIYEEPTRLQATVARRMAESKATAPHFYLRVQVDMSAALRARERLKQTAADGDVVPSLNDVVVKACALALREHPRANGAYRDGRFELYSRVNVGIAVAAHDTLVVPTVFDADRKGLREIAVESRELSKRVREGTITPPELSGATFTVSNLGMFGIEGFSAVINPPQAAILAVGAVAERPVVRAGQIVPAHLMSAELACDHRVLYGAQGAELLARIRSLLEEPLALAL